MRPPADSSEKVSSAARSPAVSSGIASSSSARSSGPRSRKASAASSGSMAATRAAARATGASRSSCSSSSGCISSSASAATPGSRASSSAWRSSRPSSSSRSATSDGRRRLSAWLDRDRRSSPGCEPKGCDGRPVEHAVGRGAVAPAGRAEAAEQALEAHVDAHEAPGQADPGQVEVAGAHHPHAVDVDELAVEDVAAQHHLAGTALEVAQVEARRAQPDLVGLHGGHLGDGQERGAAPDLDHQAGGGRVGAAVPAGDHVGDAADLVTGLVADGLADDAGERDQGIGHRPVREQAAVGVALGPVTERGGRGQGWATGHDGPPAGGARQPGWLGRRRHGRAAAGAWEAAGPAG